MTRKKAAQPDVPERFRRTASTLYEKADRFPNSDIKSGLLHLADLFANCSTYYPSLPIRQGDGLPLRMSGRDEASYVGSSSATCLEG